MDMKNGNSMAGLVGAIIAAKSQGVDVSRLLELSDRYGDLVECAIESYITEEYSTLPELSDRIYSARVHISQLLAPRDFQDLVVLHCGMLARRGIIESKSFDIEKTGYYYKVRRVSDNVSES